MTITTDNDFKIVAGYAKAIAAHNEKTELTTLMFLLGAKVAKVKTKLNENLAVLDGIGEKIQDIAKKKSITVDDAIEPLTNQTFPLHKDLKSLIKQCNDLKLSDLVFQIAKELKLVEEEVEDNITSEIVSDPVFLKINAYAEKLTCLLGISSDSPEVYAVGALIALNKGDLAERPALTAHINAYSREYKSWLVQNGVNFAEILEQVSGEHALTEWSDGHLIHKFKSSKNPFIALLNAGIDKVSEIRSRECVAYHEAGHAVVSLVLRPKVSLDMVTIVSSEDYNGLTAFDNTNPIYKHGFPCTREDFLEDLCVSLAGQASQLKRYGFNAADVGAHCDYAGATEFAWQYITEFGLDDVFGPVQLSVLSRSYGIKSGWLFDEAQKRLQAILKEAQQKTEIILTEHWDCVERVVKGLLEKKTLNEDEVRSLMTQIE